MLKISDMAKLANTTRRTLIFYDEQGVFTPAHKSASGYRYYDYKQLYDLMTILGLRNIGLSLEQIKAIQSGGQPALPVLRQAQGKISDQIKKLQRIEAVLDQRLHQQNETSVPQLYVPEVTLIEAATFWCSRKAVDCTEQEVAQLFAEFYQELDAMTLLDTATSGFLTDLPVSDPAGYKDAGFRILKATDQADSADYLPLLQKPAGRYVRVWIANTAAGIDRGLNALKAYCEAQHLQVQDRLWQLNSGDTLVENGATQYGWLEYAVN